VNIINKIRSRDGMAVKYSMVVRDSVVEGTYVGLPEKHVICFSTQLGCAVDCMFCAAGPPVKPLMTGDMIQMALAMHRDAKVEATDERPVLFSAMGEGEPLFSAWQRTQVVGALDALNATVPFSRTALSTSGTNPAEIRQLGVSPPKGLFKLQVSMPSTDMRARRLLMKNAVEAEYVRAAVGYYQGMVRGPVDWNVVLFDGVNDSDMDAFMLSRLLGFGENVKLTRYNVIPDRGLEPSKRSAEFGNLLLKLGLRVEHYRTNGADVGGACGQLRHKLFRIDDVPVA
jgi:23S rRNA (adenine2503-C2)-methyltransferase